MHFSLRGSPCQAGACLAERHLDLHSALAYALEVQSLFMKTDFHVLNNLHLVGKAGMAEWTRIVGV